MSTPTHPGYGWRFLKDGEVIQPGDDWLSCAGWEPSHSSIGVVFVLGISCPHRRRIDPGEGREIVPEDERLWAYSLNCPLQSTTDGEKWNPHSWSHEVTVKEAIRICAEEGSPKRQILAFRRRKQPETKAEKQEGCWWGVMMELPACCWHFKCMEDSESAAIKEAKEYAQNSGRRIAVVRIAKPTKAYVLQPAEVKEVEL